MQGKRWSVARQLLVLQAALLTVVLLAAAVAAFEVSGRRDENAARDEVLDLARSVAANPFVVAQAHTAKPWVSLQPYAERVRRDTGVGFVVVMAPDRTRWSHPNPRLIGRPFIGTIAPALHGRAFTETYTGTLGPSVRAVAPVRDGWGGSWLSSPSASRRSRSASGCWRSFRSCSSRSSCCSSSRSPARRW